MAQRVFITEAVRAAVERMLAMKGCDVCGEDLTEHEWFDVQGAGTPDVRIVRCKLQDE